MGCLFLLVAMDLVCGLILPIYETLFYMRYDRKDNSKKLSHWTTYWIFYALLHLIQRALYFFPFSYEIRVLATIMMAHPRINAASLVYDFLVTNPLLTIKAIDARNRIRDHIDKQVLPKLMNFRLY